MEFHMAFEVRQITITDMFKSKRSLLLCHLNFITLLQCNIFYKMHHHLCYPWTCTTTSTHKVSHSCCGLRGFSSPSRIQGVCHWWLPKQWLFLWRRAWLITPSSMEIIMLRVRYRNLCQLETDGKWHISVFKWSLWKIAGGEGRLWLMITFIIFLYK